MSSILHIPNGPAIDLREVSMVGANQKYRNEHKVDIQAYSVFLKRTDVQLCIFERATEFNGEKVPSMPRDVFISYWVAANE